MFGSGAMVYAAVLQHYIYKAGPCYDHPLDCQTVTTSTLVYKHLHMSSLPSLKFWPRLLVLSMPTLRHLCK